MTQVRIRAKTPRDAKIANLVTMASLRPLASLREPAFADAMSARPHKQIESGMSQAEITGDRRHLQPPGTLSKLRSSRVA